ncbi:Reverse transcriptase (RNA-dependent DNA polymerase) [Rhizoctonia solani]|uniref:Reverse transcriptase (RNA-dependent DNA polymerase) n=1 Tax=Rhizoctonia solani TaxID=456999 RepID=A0A8H7M211_9AGAM|nr:Reverse transcriptase (RNA-dependent DNA polymerase) [Rhizoctonia solani]
MRTGNVSTGAQTRSRNPNPTHVSLQQERGGVRIKLPNNVATGQLNNQATNKTTNLVLDLPDAASMHSNSSNVDLDAYTFSTNTSSILSAPTIPSKLAYPLATPPATKLDTSLSNLLNNQFSYLNLSKSTSTKLDTTLATPGDVEHEWAYAAKLSAPKPPNHCGSACRTGRRGMAKSHGKGGNGNAWVFTLKRNANGTPARYKGQLVAQGFSQQPGMTLMRRLHLYQTLTQIDMQDLGNIHHFLGIAIVQNPIIAGLDNAYPADTPISPTTQLTQYKGTKPKFNYDIAYAVAHLAQFTTCYGPAHVTAVNCVVRYLKGTLALGLTYWQSTNDFGEIGYSDADWGSNLLDSKKQATVALLTMEAKYMSLSHACTQALWMRQLFEELNFTTDNPTLILSDNLAALALSAKLQFHGQSKHINI